MNLLLVSHVHPESGLVGGLRLYRLAQELAARGHRVVLLCGTLGGPGDDAGALPRRLTDHDWATPLVVAAEDRCPVASTQLAPLRKARTALRLILRGGPFWRWRRNALVFAEPMRTHFRPDVTYGTFGDLDALALAREIAKRCDVPWVMDLKDPATRFLPRALRPALMPRYRDAAAVTLNSEYQRSHNPGWADDDAILLYSGAEAPLREFVAHDPLHVALVGSIYDAANLTTFLRGFRLWRQQTSNAATLHYFGVNVEPVAQAAERVGISQVVRVEGQRPRSELLERCQRMAAIGYIRSAATFHHKLIELAALGRPLLACPGEGKEALELARRNDIDLACVQDEQAVACALDRAAAETTIDTQALINKFSWASAATRLEQVLQSVIGDRKDLGA